MRAFQGVFIANRASIMFGKLYGILDFGSKTQSFIIIIIIPGNPS